MLYRIRKRQPRAAATVKNKILLMESESALTPDLPCSIIMDILGRLPMKTLLQCRHVCKAWHTLLSENYFYVLYGGRTPTSLILQVKGYTIDSLRSIWLVEADDNSSTTYWNLEISRASSPDVPDFKYQLGNSCNGLICLRELSSREPIAIWNPIMGHYSILPRPISVSDDKVVSGFGFCSRTNQYKVLRVFHEKHAPQSEWATEVFDFCVNSSRWRRVVDAPCPIPSRIPGFYLYNCLHWILDYAGSNSWCSDHELICCFDFMDEKFRSVPPPPIFSMDGRYKNHWSNLGILQGCLSICSIDAKVFRPDVQVWVMEEYGVAESWVKKLSFKDPAVDWWDPHRWIQVVNLLKNGKIVILCGHRFVLVYDPEERNFLTMKSLDFPAIAHFPCFVSLKDVVSTDFTSVQSVPSVAYLAHS
ncbi:hypothetical protein Dimus_019665 [Dionaea muscipula]